MSWVRIWVHLVFSTKKRFPFLKTEQQRLKMFKHIKENALKKDIFMDCVNGYNNHAHCLISLGREQSISQVAQLIKGESAFWINKEKILDTHFNWQDDYWAVGVSEKHIAAVKNYIHKQEKHHKTKTFKEEIDEFMEKYGWELIKGA